MLRKIVKGFLHFLIIIVYRVKKVGEENIPKKGAYILCGNHVHALDAPVLVLSSKRQIRFIIKEELYKNKFLKWLGTLFGCIAIKRNSADIEAIKQSMKVLKNNELLGLFPEGTRNGMKKNADIKEGAAYIALKAGVPVIPIGIQGDFKAFHKVKLNYGKPLDFSQYREQRKEKEVLEKVSKEIMDNIIRLTNEQI